MNAQVQRRFRVGIVVDGLQMASWSVKLVTDIQASQLAEVVLVIRILGDGVGNAHNNDSGNGSFLYRLYRIWDSDFFRPQPDAFLPMNLLSVLPSCPVLEILPDREGQCIAISETELSKIQQYDLDIAVQVTPHSLSDRSLTIARHGVWSHQFDGGYEDRSGPGGFWQVMERNAVTGSALVALTQSSEQPVVLQRSYAASDTRSVRRNISNVAWKASSLTMRTIRDLYHRNGGTAPYAYEGEDTTQWPVECNLPPDNIKMARLLMRHGFRCIRDKLHNFCFRDDWVLFYRFTGDGADNQFTGNDYQPILPPKGRFYADPFCVQRDDKYFIFLEEFIDDLGKGVISLMLMDGQGRTEKPERVIERDYHLSYPFIFSYKNEHYIVPESVENRTVELYRCVSWPERWEAVDVMLRNIQAADATIEKIDDTYWMFTTISSAEGLRPCDKLHLFYATTPFGPWKPHAANPVKLDVRSSRPAGRLFRHQGRLYRPAQDCSRRYGYAISINEVERITPREYSEREVYRILPNWSPEVLATHTLNRTGRLTVIDARVPRRK